MKEKISFIYIYIKKKFIHIMVSPLNNNNNCRSRLWFLGLKDEWIKAQRAQYNKFVESMLKS